MRKRPRSPSLTRIGPNARRALRDSILVAPGYLVPGIATLIGVPILFRTLGAAEYGLWSLINAIASGVPPLTTSSVEALTLRFGHRDQDRRRIRERVVAASASGALGAVLAFLFIPGDSVATVVVTAALSTAVGVYLLWSANLQSGLRFGSASAVASARALLGLALAVLGAVITGSAIAAAWGLTAGFTTAVVASFFLRPPVDRTDGERAQPAPPLGTRRLSYGLGSILVAVGLFELSVGDRFILSALSGMSDVGIYAAVYTIEDLVLRLTPSVVLVAIRPRIFRAWDGAHVGRVMHSTAGVTAVIVWLGLALTAGILLAGELLGATGSVAPLLGPIAVGLSAGVAASSLSFLYSAAERQWRLASHVSVAAVLNVALNLLWIPEHGALAAAYVTAISFTTLLGLHVVGLDRSLLEDRAFVALGVSSLGLTILIGFGSSAVGGLIWPVSGLLAAAALVPLALRSGRVLIPSIDAPSDG